MAAHLVDDVLAHAGKDTLSPQGDNRGAARALRTLMPVPIGADKRIAMLVKVIAAILVLFGAYQCWESREVPQPPGILAPHQPIQKDIANPEPFDFKGYRITPLAAFEIEARVLSRERYRRGREADLSPIDLALGWGPMSAQQVLDQLDISQSHRYYRWQTDHLPLPAHVIARHSANMHIIPAGDPIEDELMKIRKGHIVRLGGYLVQATAPDGWRWRSSLSRKDTGGGACEIVLVNRIAVL